MSAHPHHAQAEVVSRLGGLGRCQQYRHARADKWPLVEAALWHPWFQTLSTNPASPLTGAAGAAGQERAA